MDDALADKDLARAGGRAQPCGEVQGGATIAVLHGDGLTCVKADPHAHRYGRLKGRFVGEYLLELDRRADRTSGRSEDRECFIAAEFDHVSRFKVAS